MARWRTVRKSVRGKDSGTSLATARPMERCTVLAAQRTQRSPASPSFNRTNRDMPQKGQLAMRTEKVPGAMMDNPARNLEIKPAILKGDCAPTYTVAGFGTSGLMPNTLIARATSFAFIFPSCASAAMAAWATW